jgi:hypothetical protein
MDLEIPNELKEFLATLDPIWEDIHEFDWLREKTDLVINQIR